MVNTNIEVKKMNKIFKSILMFVLAFLFLLLGVAILPLISNLGENILYLFVGFSILIYTYGLLLIKRVVKAKGTIYVISLTETILLTMIALFSIINFFVDIRGSRRSTEKFYLRILSVMHQLLWESRY